MCINRKDGSISDRGNVKVWAAILVIISSICVSIATDYSMENIKREQARYNLQQMKYCYSKLHGIETDKEIFGICTNKMKTSYTGDVYVLDANTLEFVHETSRDVPRKEPLYFTKESVGKYFKDWESGRVARNVILLGKDSEEGVNASYRFDNGIEWLEWIYLPDEFAISPRYVVVQGIQRDEVMEHIVVPKTVALVSTLGIVLLLLIANSAGRRNDDC